MNLIIVKAMLKIIWWYKSINEVISEKEAELAKKIEEVKDRNYLISDTDEQLSKKIAIIIEDYRHTVIVCHNRKGRGLH